MTPGRNARDTGLMGDSWGGRSRASAMATMKAVALGIITVVVIGGVASSDAAQRVEVSTPQVITCLHEKERLITAGQLLGYITRYKPTFVVELAVSSEKLTLQEWYRRYPEQFAAACKSTLDSLDPNRTDDRGGEEGGGGGQEDSPFEDPALVALGVGLTFLTGDVAARIAQRRALAERVRRAAVEFKIALDRACSKYVENAANTADTDEMSRRAIILYEELRNVARRYSQVKKYFKDEQRVKIMRLALGLEKDDTFEKLMWQGDGGKAAAKEAQELGKDIVEAALEAARYLRRGGLTTLGRKATAKRDQLVEEFDQLNKDAKKP